MVELPVSDSGELLVTLYLFSTFEEEFVRIYTVADRAANERYPMKDQRWLIRAFQEQLLHNIEQYRKQNE